MDERMRKAREPLHDAFTIPGTKIRVGLDPVLSLIPGAGTTSGAVLATSVIIDAIRLRAPLPVLARMGANYLFDWLIGMVPVLGAVGDLAFRANRKNLRLLNRTIADREQVRHAGVKYWIAAAGILVGILLIALVLGIGALVWLWNALATA
ncbi:MAG: DUF4112 domain-containing protein [Propionibacteriaceae bacterium]|nr:DUF4112 domain-containing protein [Propionibacteriaceae bacterium]